MNRQSILLALVLIGTTSTGTAGAPRGSDLPCQQSPAADRAPTDLAVQTIPAPTLNTAFPDYKLRADTSRKMPLTPSQAAAILLDFERQCRSCTYQLDNIEVQKIFEQDPATHRYLVWRSVKKNVNIGFKKLPVQSSSFAEVQVFESLDKLQIIIDSRSLSETCAAQKSLLYAKPSDPAFDPFHTRWMLTALDPTRHEGMQVEITGTTAGVPRGVAAKAPKLLLSWELKNALEETLDLISPR